MTLKDAMQHDHAAFLNMGEFAEDVVLDGESVRAIWSNSSSTRITANSADSYQPTLPIVDCVLHVRTKDISPEIATGGSVTLNEELCSVFARHDDPGGMTRLELTRNGYWQ